MRKVIETTAEVRPAADLRAAAKKVRAAHEAARKAGAANAEAARQAGQELAKVQGPLKEAHDWLRWLREDVGLSRRTAADYLKIYQDRDKWAAVAHLGVRGVLEFLRTGQTGEEDDGEEEALGLMGGEATPAATAREEEAPRTPEDLDGLATAINAAHAAGMADMRSAAEHSRKARELFRRWADAMYAGWDGMDPELLEQMLGVRRRRGTVDYEKLRQALAIFRAAEGAEAALDAEEDKA
jgi:hypothetical protein